MAPIWLWLIAAGILALLEMGLPGTFFFLFLAVAALLAGLSSLLFPWWELQMGVFLAAGVGALLLAPRIARRLTPPSETVPLNVDSLVGQIGIVQEEIDPIHGQGTINVQGQVWRALAETSIPAGERVRVRAVQGTKLVVSLHQPWERLLAEEPERPPQIQQQRRGS